MSLALLARYRNSLRPFHRLTSDILITIFLEIQNSFADPYGPFFGSYAFMSYAKVCHTWRHLALTSPMLWKQISTKYPTAALVALERSADAGIHLVIPEGSKPEIAKQVLEAVATHSHRLRRLYLPSDILKKSDGTIDAMLLPLINSPAPLLETIDTVKMRGEGGCVPLPVLFAGQTPRLRRLHIQYMRPLVSSVTMRNLRDLSFCGKKRLQISMTISELLDLLEAAPMLQLLEARKVNWEPAAEEDKTSPIYGMPVLQVWKAGTVMFIKRSLASGYAGIDNPLFYRDNTMMLLGDAKKMSESIVKSM